LPLIENSSIGCSQESFVSKGWGERKENSYCFLLPLKGKCSIAKNLIVNMKKVVERKHWDLFVKYFILGNYCSYIHMYVRIKASDKSIAMNYNLNFLKP
jgi:hypothetical protein